METDSNGDCDWLVIHSTASCGHAPASWFTVITAPAATRQASLTAEASLASVITTSIVRSRYGRGGSAQKGWNIWQCGTWLLSASRLRQSNMAGLRPKRAWNWRMKSDKKGARAALLSAELFRE